MKKLSYIPLIAIVSLLLFTVCKVVENDDSTDTIKVLALENEEVTGWNELDVDGYVPFNASNMYDLVNGGAKEYVQKGLIEGFEQKMTKKNTERVYKGWVMDFGTEDKAVEMYNVLLTENASSKEAAGSYAESVAFLAPENYGYMGNAHFGKYVLWMQFDGYGANKSEAKNNLLGFLTTIEDKIAGMK